MVREEEAAKLLTAQDLVNKGYDLQANMNEPYWTDKKLGGIRPDLFGAYTPEMPKPEKDIGFRERGLGGINPDLFGEYTPKEPNLGEHLGGGLGGINPDLFGEYTPKSEPLKYDTSTHPLKIFQDGSPGVADQFVDTYLNSRNAQIKTDFAAQQDKKRAQLMRRAASTYGAEGARKLWDDVETTHLYSKLAEDYANNPDMDYTELIKKIMPLAMKSRNFAGITGLAATREGLKPKPQMGAHIVNHNNKPHMFIYDLNNPKNGTLTPLENYGPAVP